MLTAKILLPLVGKARSTVFSARRHNRFWEGFVSRSDFIDAPAHSSDDAGIDGLQVVVFFEIGRYVVEFPRLSNFDVGEVSYRPIRIACIRLVYRRFFQSYFGYSQWSSECCLCSPCLRKADKMETPSRPSGDALGIPAKSEQAGRKLGKYQTKLFLLPAAILPGQRTSMGFSIRRHTVSACGL